MLQLASKLGDDQLLVQTYYATEFKNFYNGSVWAIAQVKFDLNDSLAARYTQDHVQAHLITGGTKLLKLLANTTVSSPTDFGQINISTFVVHAVDPCTAGRHDCSVNAVCKIISPGIYTCECNTFTIDVSNDNFYPGRRCVYDGLIIFTFIVVGGILSMLIFVLCGCRRTIWYRYGNRQAQEHLTLVNMPANYEI
ncbi:hypothetical protein P879_00553 [Paragonimus westermani]|uniref:EGF-like domain-containing protein n=1 Tax=Paragonimus westermani TaxID=34504 RepID=A0A8T0DZD8_9TREM|nr:hypothetical protein P879_00553 [Paragonimus westermani]